jgi:hypothetical protein
LLAKLHVNSIMLLLSICNSLVMIYNYLDLSYLIFPMTFE